MFGFGFFFFFITNKNTEYFSYNNLARYFISLKIVNRILLYNNLHTKKKKPVDMSKYPNFRYEIVRTLYFIESKNTFLFGNIFFFFFF